MSWQIQCKQHFLKQLYTLNNQLESQETLTWHEDVQMYCWDCMRVRRGDYNECWACVIVKRGAMFCRWMCMRVVWELIDVLWELREVLWELLREVLWERLCESCWERRSNILCIPRDPDQTKQDGIWWETDMTSPHGVSDHIYKSRF